MEGGCGAWWLGSWVVGCADCGIERRREGEGGGHEKHA